MRKKQTPEQLAEQAKDAVDRALKETDPLKAIIHLNDASAGVAELVMHYCSRDKGLEQPWQAPPEDEEESDDE